jgi:hypothetical protein
MQTDKWDSFNYVAECSAPVDTIMQRAVISTKYLQKYIEDSNYDSFRFQLDVSVSVLA